MPLALKHSRHLKTIGSVTNVTDNWNECAFRLKGYFNATGSLCLSPFLSQMVRALSFWLGDKVSSFSRLHGNAGAVRKGHRASRMSTRHNLPTHVTWITPCLCWLCALHFTTAIRALEIKWWKMEIANVFFFSAGVSL